MAGGGTLHDFTDDDTIVTFPSAGFYPGFTVVAKPNFHTGWQYTTTAEPIPAPAPLPKALVAGPTIAYRLWRLRRLQSGLRIGAVAHDRWMRPGEPLAARCEAGDGWTSTVSNGFITTRTGHSAPAVHCQCGWYGVNDWTKVSGYEASGADVAIIAGQVALWGRVIEHEHGYRAQYAYPVRLWSIESPVPLPVGFPKVSYVNDAIEEVAALYGCEVGRA